MSDLSSLGQALNPRQAVAHPRARYVTPPVINNGRVPSEPITALIGSLGHARMGV